jgi:hypothetical protein
MAIDRPPGIGNASSDQLFTCIGGLVCGVGIDRLGSGGSLLTDGGASNDLLTGACNVGMSGALLYGPGANPWACLFGGGSTV